jgi:outer membrane lipoprotein-sorting protein
MRKTTALVLMMGLCLLTGCSKEHKLEQYGGEVQETFQNVSAISFTAEVTAHGSTAVESYTLSGTWTPEQTELAVTAPEEIAGVGAVLENETLQLQFDGVLLDAGNLDGIEQSPLTAPSTMIGALREGYLISAWEEEQDAHACVVLELMYGEEMRLRIWMDPDTGTPLSCEFYRDDTAFLSCVVSDWTATTGDSGT